MAEAVLDLDAPRPPRLGLGVRAGYGLGTLASGISGTVLAGSVLQVYFNQVVGLDPAWVGFAISLTIFIDSITDPLIGRFSDGLRTRWGRRHVLMYASALPSALGCVAMWYAPAGLGPAGLLVFMVGMLLFVRVSTSFYDIPARALAPELAPDYHERTALIAWRYLFGLAGAAAMNAILYSVFLAQDASNPLGVLNRDRYVQFGVFSAVLLFVVVIVSTMATHGRIRHLHVPPVEKQSLADALRELRAAATQKGMPTLMFATMLNGFGGGLWFGLLGLLFLNFWALLPQEIGYIGWAAPLGSVISLWLAPYVSAKVGKRPFMMACYLGWLIFFVTPFMMRYWGMLPTPGAQLWPVLAVFDLIATIFALGVHTLLQSMLTDAADSVSVKTGRRSEGVLFAAFGLLDKWGIALGAFGAGLVLKLIHFPTGAAPGTVAPEIVNNLALACVPLVAGCNVFAMAMMSRFKLDHAQHNANIEALAARELERAT